MGKKGPSIAMPIYDAVDLLVAGRSVQIGVDRLEWLWEQPKSKQRDSAVKKELRLTAEASKDLLSRIEAYAEQRHAFKEKYGAPLSVV